MTEKQKELLSLLKYQETLATLNYKLNISSKQVYRKIISLKTMVIIYLEKIIQLVMYNLG